MDALHPAGIELIIGLCGAKSTTIWELHNVSGDELGRNTGTISYHFTEADAKLASKKLGHTYFGISRINSVIQLPTGEVFILQGCQVVVQDPEDL